MRIDCTHRAGIARRALNVLAVAMLAWTLAACGGGGGGGGVDGDIEEDTTPAAPGGSGTGADGAPIFWKVLGYNQGYGRANAVVENSDGSFVVAGFQASSGAPNDVFVAKTDRAGTALWEKRIPVAGGAIAYALRAVPAGGYMLAGTVGTEGAARGFLLKVDGGGNALAGWPKTYGDSATQFFAMLPVNGGADGFVLTGINANKLYVVRVAADGAVQWTKNDYLEFCGGGGSGAAAAITATQDGRYVLAGRTGCNQWAGFLMKIEAANGNEVWRRVVDDVNTAWFASLDAVVATSDGSLLASGRVGANCEPGDGGASCDMLVVKTDGAGAVQWERRYGGTEIDVGMGAALAADGSYLVAGTSRSYGGTIEDRSVAFMWDDLFIVKITGAGDTQWQKVKGVRPRAVDESMALLRSGIDGGFVIAGETGGNPLLVKFDKNGDTVNLGATYDLTVTVPSTTGLVNFDDAQALAGAGASALLLPPQAGAPMLDLLIAASKGVAPADFCSGGGSYAFSPAVPSTLVAGGSWTLSFSNCATGVGLDAMRINGSVALRLDAISGAPGGSDYGATLAATNIGLAIEDLGATPALTQSLAGALTVERTVAAGSRTDHVFAPLGGSLTFSESSGGATFASATLASFSIRTSTPTSGTVRLATTGDSAEMLVGSARFSIGVLQSIDLSATTLEPVAGIYQVRAPVDNSQLTATLSSASGSASVTLAIDADGDGTVDGSVSVPWESIY
jgi:hypothetical protein